VLQNQLNIKFCQIVALVLFNIPLAVSKEGTRGKKFDESLNFEERESSGLLSHDLSSVVHQYIGAWFEDRGFFIFSIFLLIKSASVQ
jgi:hypothetical protein